MKTLFLSTIACLLFIGSASAEENFCVNGNILKANDGTIYCTSKDPLSWEKASAWCSEQKMHFVSWQEACPGSNFPKNCSNLRGIGEGSIWTSSKYHDHFMYRVNLACGCTNRESYLHKYLALCK